MNPIIKNLVHIIRRFKLAAILNILGLSVAFAAFMIIMIQLNYNFSFGKFHQDYDKIYRLEMIRGSAAIANISRPVAELFFESSPHIVAGGLNNGGGQTFFFVNTDEEWHSYVEPSSTVSSGFFDVFTFDFVEGSIEEMASRTIISC
jgi:putative ABC transport system permease protein